MSLDAPKYDDDDDESMVDGMTGELFGEASDKAEQASLGKFHARCGKARKNEREVVMARWGLHNSPPLSRAEIADKLG